MIDPLGDALGGARTAGVGPSPTPSTPTIVVARRAATWVWDGDNLHRGPVVAPELLGLAAGVGAQVLADPLDADVAAPGGVEDDLDQHGGVGFGAFGDHGVLGRVERVGEAERPGPHARVVGAAREERPLE